MQTDSERRITRIPSDATTLPALIREGAARHGEVSLPGQRKPSLISILVPVRGLEEHPTDNITALLGQRFSIPAEIIFCVESADDPVVPVLEPL